VIERIWLRMQYTQILSKLAPTAKIIRRGLSIQVYRSMGDQIKLQPTPEKSHNPSTYLKQYNLHSWKPNESRSCDENYMDIVMILTRSVQFRQGSMGCIIVNPPSRSHDNFFEGIIGANTNQSLFNKDDSDIHAEIATLGSCSQNGNTTKDSTVYITMPPCKRCFGALCAAGVKRIVTNREYSKLILDAAKVRDIELVTMSREFSDQQKDRISEIFNASANGGNINMAEERLRRKEEKRRRKEGRHAQDEEEGEGRIKVQKIE